VFGFGVVAILFLARQNHVSDISSHADVDMCVTVCMTVHVFLSAANCVSGVNGASDGIQLEGGLHVIQACIQLGGGVIQSLIISDSKFI